MKRALVVIAIMAAIASCMRTVVLDPQPDALPDAGVPDGPNPDGVPADAPPSDGSSPDAPHD